RLRRAGTTLGVPRAFSWADSEGVAGRHGVPCNATAQGAGFCVKGIDPGTAGGSRDVGLWRPAVFRSLQVLDVQAPDVIGCSQRRLGYFLRVATVNRGIAVRRHER